MDNWQCEVCNYQGEPTNIKRYKEEWGTDVECECPHCESKFLDGECMDREEGEICAFCGEFVDEVVEINLGGSDTDKVCIECEEEHWK